MNLNELSNTIRTDLLNFYQARLERPNSQISTSFTSFECALFFCRSKSWHKKVEKKFKAIISNNTIKNEKITEWVKRWLDFISELRKDQDEIIKCSQKIYEIEKNISELAPLLQIDKPDHSEAIARFEFQKREMTQRVSNLKERIQGNLKNAKDEINPLDVEIKQDYSCQKIVNFLSKNWDSLTLFSKFPEISMDEEKIFVNLKQSRQEISFERMLNGDKSIKGIFIVEEKSHKKTSYKYVGEENGQIVRSTQISLKNSYLAPKNHSFSQLEELVRSAINGVNEELSKKEEWSKKEKIAHHNIFSSLLSLFNRK